MPLGAAGGKMSFGSNGVKTQPAKIMPASLMFWAPPKMWSSVDDTLPLLPSVRLLVRALHVTEAMTNFGNANFGHGQANFGDNLKLADLGW